jgi:hypothetical protein
MTTYAQGRIYPGSVPEFRSFQKNDGTIAMQVRYINGPMGYEGKWMDVKTEKESDMQDNLKCGGGGVTYYDFFFTKNGKPTLRRRVGSPFNLGE